MTIARAPAKLNLALVVGPRRPDGLHEVTTVLQRLELADAITVEPAGRLVVDGFAEDTLVHGALEAVAARRGVEPHWHVEITKRIPVSAGLAGGSSDAAAALRLANGTLDPPLTQEELRALAAGIGADVPFFLAPGPQLGEGTGTELSPLELPQDYCVLLILPDGAEKRSTAAVYADFDARGGEHGYEERRASVLDALRRVREAPDLAALPPNDLASSPLAAELLEAGAFRADVSGAGPTVYGLFAGRAEADAARHRLRARGRAWLTEPAWYV